MKSNTDNEKSITFNELYLLLKQNELRYTNLMFSRIPEHKNGVRTLYVIADNVVENDMDRIASTRKTLWDEYHICLMVVPSKTTWINRQYDWMKFPEETDESTA